MLRRCLLAQQAPCLFLGLLQDSSARRFGASAVPTGRARLLAYRARVVASEAGRPQFAPNAARQLRCLDAIVRRRWTHEGQSARAVCQSPGRKLGGPQRAESPAARARVAT